MDVRRIIKNYIWDNYSCSPTYYSMKRNYIMEYSWEHWACDEILYRYALLPNEDSINVIRGYNDEMRHMLDIAKKHNNDNPAAVILFTTALAVGQDIEELLRAMR